MSARVFEPGSIDDRRGGERRVAVKAGATWCSMCDDLDAAVLATPAGRAIFEGLETVSFDFDAAPELAKRFAILELPTVIVLRPDGVEVGRVVGFEDADEWIALARDAVRAEDPIPTLRAEAASGAIGPMLALGEALLSRAPDEAVAWLERVSWGEGVAAMHALWVLGRWHHRVLGDAATARYLWQQLVLRFPDGDHGGLWWYAKAQVELGRVELGSRAYEAFVARRPDDAAAIVDWARFAGRERHEPARAAIRAACEVALRRARGADRDRLEDLVMNLSRPL